MTPRRIRIVGMHYAPEPSGNAPYTSGLAVGLARRGHLVQVITGVPHYPAWSVFEGYEHWRAVTQEDGVAVTRLRHYVPHRPSPVRRVLMEASFGARAATQHWPAVDVTICVSPALFSSAVVAARSAATTRSTPLGLWVQDLYSVGVTEAAAAGRLVVGATTSLERRLLHAMDGVAVVHERFETYVVEQLGVDEDRVTVIRNWTHLPPATGSDVAVTRARHGWTEGTVVALHAGNMGVKQGLENVVEAARVASRTGSEVRFVFVGDGNQRESLQALAEGLPTVTFLSSLPDSEYQDILGAADVLLVNEKPGVAEMSVPSKLTSYYTTGRPVVAACAEGSVTHHEIELSGAGVRVDPGAPEELLKAVVDLAHDLPQAQELGRRGREFVGRRLSGEAALDAFECWIESLLRPGAC